MEDSDIKQELSLCDLCKHKKNYSDQTCRSISMKASKALESLGIDYKIKRCINFEKRT